MASIPITPCFLKFRAFSSSSSSQYSYNHNTQIGLMLASNSVRSLRRPSLLSSSIPNFRVSKFAPKSISLLPQTSRFCETHQRLTRKFIVSYLLSLVGPNTAFYKVLLGVTKRQFASFFRSSNLRFFFEKALCGEIQKWKISCFRNEEFCSGESNPEVIEEVLQEEQRKSEIDKSSVGKRDWISLLAEAPNIVRKVIGEPWDVPWTAKTIFQVMLLWIVSFWFIGSWMIPFGAHLVGFSKESLTFRGQALFSLLTDVTEGLAGILILQRCLSRFRPLPRDWFKFSMRGNWIFDLVLGCFMFPLVNRLSQFNLDLLPVLPSTPVTLSSVEQSIMARDPVAMALYALVLVVCAPMWEEIVFRGFLLPSLTKYMPVWCSILVSSVAFALAHFNVQRMLPLIFLGVVMGIIYARSRNILPSILLHSLWNGFVFIDLMK